MVQTVRDERPLRLSWGAGKARADEVLEMHMSARSEALANRFEEANQEVIGMLSICPAGDLAKICPAEGWTVSALGAHIGLSHKGILENLIKPVVAGQEIPPFDLARFAEGNAKAAAENEAMPQERIVQILRENGAEAAAYVRGLTDEDLDRQTVGPIMGDQRATVQQLIEMVLIGHAVDHGKSLREGLA